MYANFKCTSSTTHLSPELFDSYLFYTSVNNPIGHKV